jgi:hypothetical protein
MNPDSTPLLCRVVGLPNAWLSRYGGLSIGLSLLLIQAVLLSAYHPGMMHQMLNPHSEGKFQYDCSPRPDDPEGYLVAVCEYLNENQIWAGRGAPYDISSITKSEKDGRVIVIIEFACCGTGDIAAIDKETGEVLGYTPGIW